MEIDRQENKEGLDKLNLSLKSSLGLTFKDWIQDFLNDLSERLEKMEEILVVDRIEGNIAVCENRASSKMQDIAISDLPKGVKEGDVLKWKDGKYEIDTPDEIQNRIEQKMKNVWKD